MSDYEPKFTGSGGEIRLWAVALLAGGSIVAVGGLGAWAHSTYELGKDREARAIQNGKNFAHVQVVSPNVYELAAGVKLVYSPPSCAPGSPVLEQVNQVVEKGKVIDALAPFKCIDANKDQWLGVRVGLGKTTLQGREVHTLWVNRTGENRTHPGRVTEVAGHDLMTGRVLPFKPDIPVTIVGNGEVHSAADINIPYAGLAVPPQDAATAHVLAQSIADR